MPRTKEKMLEPIPKGKVKAWNALVKETIKVVNRQDATAWELIELAGKVGTEYGENRIRRWADESGLSYSQARQYQWLARKGVDAEFVAQWARTDRRPTGLSYSVIREIISFAGGVTPYAIEYLNWALEHKATVVAIRAFMHETIAPHEHKNAAATDIKLAMADKQQHEGFSDYVRTTLEKMAEQHPEAEKEILATVFTNVEDLDALKIAAGIVSKEEEALVDESVRAFRKLKTMRHWLRESAPDIKTYIAYGHEVSEDVLAMIESIKGIVDDIATTEVGYVDSTTIEHIEVEL